MVHKKNLFVKLSSGLQSIDLTKSLAYIFPQWPMLEYGITNAARCLESVLQMSPMPPICLTPVVCWPSVPILLIGMIFMVVSFMEYHRLCHVAQMMPLSKPCGPACSAVYLPPFGLKKKVWNKINDSKMKEWNVAMATRPITQASSTDLTVRSMELSSCEVFTLVVFAIEVCGMAAVHPPAWAILCCTVPIILVVVPVAGTELHPVVRGEDFVAGVVTEVKAVERVARISSKVVGVDQPVIVYLRAHFEAGVICIPGK